MTSMRKSAIALQNSGRHIVAPNQFPQSCTAAKEYLMKRFISYLFVAAFALVLTKSVDAAPKAPLAPKAVQSDIEVGGQKIGSAKVNLNGFTKLPKLKSGHTVSLQLKNGLATGVQVTDSKGMPVQASVRNE